jgi:prophage antirepressor-like protein
MELVNEIDETITFNKSDIRVLGTHNEPWFVAKDICEILEIKDVSMALTKISDKWKGTKVIGTLGGEQNMRIINEAGLYKLIMRSNKPIAQKFQEFVCEEILPSIRKKGEFKLQKMLEEKEQELTLELKKKDERIKKLQRETTVVDGKNVCYLCTADEKESEGIYTIGKAINLKNRLENYNSNKLFNFKMVYYISCKSVQLMDAIEKILLSKLNKYKILSTRDVFQLPEGKDVTFFTQYFDILKNFCEDIEEDLVLEERNQEELQELEERNQEENKEAKSEYNKKYRTEHHEEILKREAVFRELNKEQLRERTLDYLFNNRDELNEKKREKAAERTEEEINKKKEYMKIYRKENAEHIAESKKKYNEEKKEIMEERIKCACGSFVSRQNMTGHLDTDRHKKYLETGKTMDETRKEDYIICVCGMSISKRGIKRHEESKIHKSYVKACDANKIE